MSGLSFDLPDVVWLAAACLAAWRIASIFNREGIMRPLRKLIGIHEEDGVFIYPETFLGELFSCLWCLSVWSGALCAAALYIFPPVLLPFAVSAAAILIERVRGDD